MLFVYCATLMPCKQKNYIFSIALSKALQSSTHSLNQSCLVCDRLTHTQIHSHCMRDTKIKAPFILSAEHSTLKWVQVVSGQMQMNFLLFLLLQFLNVLLIQSDWYRVLSTLLKSHCLFVCLLICFGILRRWRYRKHFEFLLKQRQEKKKRIIKKELLDLWIHILKKKKSLYH